MEKDAEHYLECKRLMAMIDAKKQDIKDLTGQMGQRLTEMSYMLHEKRFHSGQKFMKVEREDVYLVFRIDWRDSARILNFPATRMLKSK